MSWNDGVTKEMQDFINKELAPLGQYAEEAVKEVIDKYATMFYENVKKRTPRNKKHPEKSVNLGERLTIKKITDRGSEYYGYKIYFDGEFKQGNKTVPYEKLANILNYGSHIKQMRKDGTYGNEYENVPATGFISKEIKKLKKINIEITDEFIAKQKRGGK